MTKLIYYKNDQITLLKDKDLINCDIKKYENKNDFLNETLIGNTKIVVLVY